MTDLNSSIRARIDAFVHELNALVRASALEAVEGALGTGGPVLRRGRSAGSTSAPIAASRPKGGKRPPAEIAKTVDSLAAYVSAHPGERLEQLAIGLAISSDDLKLPIKKLLASNVIRKKGLKRGTRYFPASGGAGPKAAAEKPRRGAKRSAAAG